MFHPIHTPEIIQKTTYSSGFLKPLSFKVYQLIINQLNSITMKTSKIIRFKALLFSLILLGFGYQSYSQAEVSNENSVAINIINGDLEWGDCPDIIPSGCNVTIIHGDPTKPNADAVFKFQPGTDIPEHWHNSAERMILVQGEMTVTYEDEKTKTLKAGHYAYGPSKKPHTAKCTGSEPCLLFVGFEKPVDAFAGKPE